VDAPREVGPGGGRARALAEHLGWTLLLFLCRPQAFNFTGNQNTKFLAGAARAGVGHLREDWLAGTTDPFPLFTLLVEGMFRLGAGWLTWAGAFALLAVHLYALRVVAEVAVGRGTPGFRRTFLLLVVLAHAAVLDSAGLHLAGVPLSTLLHGGLAHQSILSNVFQPSVFGSLLLAGVALHLRDRPLLSAGAIAAAAAFHPSYLFAAAVFVPVLAWDRARRDGRMGRAAAFAGAAAAGLLPTALYLRANFAPSSEEAWLEATRILVTVRIPHHALPSRFLSGFGVAQGAWLLLGAAFAWGTEARRLYLAPFAVAAMLTAAAHFGGSLSLSAAQPWRLTVFLAPLALALGAGLLARRLAGRPAATYLLSALAAAALVGGVARGVKTRDAHFREDPGLGVYRWAKEHARPGDLFVVPIMDERFRLETGAPVLVNYKSHPNRDDEFLAWFERLNLAKDTYDAPDPVARGQRLERLRVKYGATHFVALVGRHPVVPRPGQRVYADAVVEVWRLRERR
jgi:hypothetical protein